MKTRTKRGLAWLAAAVLMLGAVPLTGIASQYDLNKNKFLDVKKTPTGKTGQNMTVSVVFENDTGNDLHGVTIGFDRETAQGEYEAESSWDDTEQAYQGSIFPFEITSSTFDKKNIGTVKAGASKTVSFSARVRRDIAEGYYQVPFEIRANDSTAALDWINVWISKGSGDKETSSGDQSASAVFELGESQSTPVGVYPNVMNFNVNVRNTTSTTAQDVNIRMVLSEDSAKFPFDINDGNYNRHYDNIGGGETISVPYSMAIRKDTYSGYYPITFKIDYKDSSEGDRLTSEAVFYVKVQNKDKEEDKGEFDKNNSKKARIIVESFETVPAEIIAGQEFELILRMKNASDSIPASNIMFTLESEKVTESAVFSTESGSSSTVVNSLGAGEIKELRFRLQSKAGVEQRAYSITIHQVFDSPEYKNADDKVSIDILVRQIPRLNIGTIDIMPDSITVGSESNVMFPVNNTGKVQLYNVMAKFEADSIQTVETYVGNIKPGETGNVDAMVQGIAPTADDGTIKITISYEDENGAPDYVEKEMKLMVTEAMDDEMMNEGMMGEGMEGLEAGAEAQGAGKYKKYIIPAATAFTAVIAAAATVAVKKRKKKKAAAEEEDVDDEIS